jgi:hypothetical protein
MSKRGKTGRILPLPSPLTVILAHTEKLTHFIRPWNHKITGNHAPCVLTIYLTLLGSARSIRQIIIWLLPKVSLDEGKGTRRILREELC